ncbi:WhiB family transcriptional regulator [Streptomyces sp. NPDC054887]
MPVEVTRTITSVGSSIRGSGTVSTRTSRRPCHVSARIVASSSPGLYDVPGPPCGRRYSTRSHSLRSHGARSAARRTRGVRGPALDEQAAAKEICGRCPVTRQCLAYALRSGQRSGVWGGLGEQERLPLHRARARGGRRAG